VTSFVKSLVLLFACDPAWQAEQTEQPAKEGDSPKKLHS
jgi:hypothetical protein